MTVSTDADAEHVSSPLAELRASVMRAAAMLAGDGASVPAQIRVERPKRTGQGDYSTNLAMLLANNKTDRASLDRARDLAAPFVNTNDGNLLDTNGWVHFKRAEYTDALSVLQRAAERQPNSKEIRYHLGMAELLTGQKDRARTDLESALSGAAKFSGAEEARTVLASLKGQNG